ncbi:MAG: thiamine ABC transporter substrate-binding protein [Oscillochloris sp.]|nr:thiamine ABC transporter substrate-binding protein [Oscillochloris sp.]
MRRLFGFMAAALLLAACGRPGASSPTAPPIVTPAANTVPMDAAPQSGQELVLLAHDSFSISEDVLAAFEQETGATVAVLRGGDAGSMLNQAILSRNAPVADLIFGIDNTFLSRALEADILEPYESPVLSAIPAELQLDPTNRMLPVDYGYVLINYDPQALAAAGLAPPSRLEDLTQPEWRGKLAVQNPATSSPGLAFLLATIAHFGSEGDYTWEDFWAELRANEVYVGNDWTDVYYTQFSGSSGAGPYPLAVSYSTSPAAEVFFSEGALAEPPTANLFVPGGSFRQIEFVGILQGTEQRELAEQFIDFMLRPTFQADIPLQMFVYPANRDVALPEVFQQFAEVPEQPASLDAVTIEAERENWLQRWTEIVLR